MDGGCEVVEVFCGYTCNLPNSADQSSFCVPWACGSVRRDWHTCMGSFLSWYWWTHTFPKYMLYLLPSRLATFQQHWEIDLLDARLNNVRFRYIDGISSCKFDTYISESTSTPSTFGLGIFNSITCVSDKIRYDQSPHIQKACRFAILYQILSIFSHGKNTHKVLFTSYHCANVGHKGFDLPRFTYRQPVHPVRLNRPAQLPYTTQPATKTSQSTMALLVAVVDFDGPRRDRNDFVILTDELTRNSVAT